MSKQEQLQPGAVTAHTAGPCWVADPAPDSNGYTTIRVADGTESGDTQAQPVATVYDPAAAPVIAAAPATAALLERALDALQKEAEYQEAHRDYWAEMGKKGRDRYDVHRRKAEHIRAILKEAGRA